MWALCELSALPRAIFGRPCTPQGSAVHLVKEISVILTHWLDNYVRILFGAAARPKLQKMIAHVLDEIISRGKLVSGDTGLKESLHKLVTPAWLRTDRRLDDYSLQLMMAEEMAVPTARLLDSKKLKNGSLNRTNVDAENDEDASIVAETENLSVLQVPRGRHVNAANLGRETGLTGIPAILQVAPSALMTTCGSVYIKGKARRYADRRHVLRDKKTFYGRPHFSWVRYVASGGEERIGRARVILTGVEKQSRRVVIVERSELAVPERQCPLTAYGCQRLRWMVSGLQEQDSNGPVPEIMLHSAIMAVLCVELD